MEFLSRLILLINQVLFPSYYTHAYCYWFALKLRVISYLEYRSCTQAFFRYCFFFKSKLKAILFNTSYGLLGASGCGKTTLLSCIVGQKKLQDGQISVLGTCLNTHSATALGPRIGYMPQDIALVNELSIKETIYYFGRIYGMHDDRIRERFKILKDLLELPDSDRLVENLSGGQKRRVSFACALVHGK